MSTVMNSPTATARGVRGAVAGGQDDAIIWEAKPGALLPPGYTPKTRIHLHGKLDDVLDAFNLLVSENRARGAGK